MKKNILFIIQTPPPYHGVSIINKHVVDIIKKNNSFNSLVIELAYSKNIEEIDRFSFYKILMLIKYYFLFIKYILNFKLDFFYIPLVPKGVGFYRDLIFVVTAKLFNIRIIFHLHRQGLNGNKIKNILLKIIFKKEFIIHLSRQLTKTEIKSSYDYKKVFIIPNGIPYKDTVPKTFNKKDKHILLFIANKSKNKGIFTLLSSINELTKIRKDFILLIIGAVYSDSIEKDIIKYIEKNTLGDFIFDLGPKYGSEKDTLMNEADIFVYPTLEDAFPLVLLEAMQYRLPIISSYEGGISDIITNNYNGILIPKNQPSILTQNLDLLLSKPELRSCLSNNAYNTFIEEYTLNKFAENVNKCFNDLIKYEP